MKQVFKLIVLSIGISLLSAKSVIAADSNPLQPQAVVVGSAPANLKQQELQLQAQELQLEQQILQIKQRLLQLQQQEAVQPAVNPTVNLAWVDADNGDIPKQAIMAANSNGNKVYICHTEYLQGVHPGQLTDKGCLISYGGRAITQTHYQVLTGNAAVKWQPASALQAYLQPYMPFNAMVVISPPSNVNGSPVQGGYEPDHALYICRAIFNNEIHVGKTFGLGRNCNIGVDGAEVLVPTFEVLFDGG